MPKPSQRCSVPLYRATAAMVVMLAFCVCGRAQDRASASTVLQLRVFGSIEVNVRTVQLQFGSVDDRISVPVQTTWNVNPGEVRNVQVIAYFENPAAALTSSDGATSVPSHDVLGSVNGSAFRGFTESNLAGPSGASLRISDTPIDASNRRHAQTDLLQLRIAPDTALADTSAPFAGTLQIEVRHY